MSKDICERLAALASSGEDLNSPTQDNGAYPLEVAVFHGDVGLIEALLAAGADPDLSSRECLICLAARTDNAEICRLLISNGCDVEDFVENDEDWDENPLGIGQFMTALQISAMNGSRACVQALLDGGANPDYRCEDIHLLNEYGERDDEQYPHGKGPINKLPLQYAIASGSIDCIKLLLDAGADPNVCDERFQTPLKQALSDRNLVRLLLDHGADPNFIPSNPDIDLLALGWESSTDDYEDEYPAEDDVVPPSPAPAMHDAAALGDIALLTCLIESGGDVNLKGDCYIEGRLELQKSPIFCANKPEVVKYLIQMGAIVDFRSTKKGNTPLIHFAGLAKTDICRLLIDAGADISAKNAKGETALDAASEAEAGSACVALLTKGRDPNHQDIQGRTPLHSASVKSVDSTRLLLAAGADVNTLDRAGDSPLHLAAGAGKAAIVRLLLKAGAQINIQNAIGRTPLHFSSEACVASTRLLITAGAETGLRDLSGQTPLHLATAAGYTDAVRVLLESGSDPNAQDAQGDSPLHLFSRLTTYGADDELVRLLLESGAEVNAKNGQGWTPLHFATARQKRPRDVRTLLKAGAKINEKTPDGATPLLLISFHGQKLDDAVGAEECDAYEKLLFSEKCAVLIEAGANIADKMHNGWSPLYYAAACGDDEIAGQLLNAGANISDRDMNEQTVLHIAAARNSHAVCEILVARGSDVNARDRNGNTPLHLVHRNGVCEILLNARADLTLTNKDGLTPKEFFALNNSPTPPSRHEFIDYADDLPCFGEDSSFFFQDERYMVPLRARFRDYLERRILKPSIPDRTDASSKDSP